MDWVSLPQEVNGPVNHLTEYNDRLIACGHFSEAGNVTAHRIAAWDGHTWEPLGGGLTSNGSSYSFAVRTLVVDSLLYVVGSFDSAGGVAAKNIARWDGTTWSGLGTGPNSIIYSIASYKGDIYVGGIFDSIGGIKASRIARWDGQNWHQVGQGITANNVNDMVVFKDELFIIGPIFNAGHIPFRSVARWNGTAWSSPSTGIGSRNTTLFVWGDKLLASSTRSIDDYFNGLPYIYSNLWNGTGWLRFSYEDLFPIFAFADYEGELYSGGGMGIGPPEASSVAKWDGTQWHTVGSGINMETSSLCTFRGDLYCGGLFSRKHDASHNFIARLATITGTDTSEDPQVHIYPNPFNTGFTIELAMANGSAPYHLTLFDITGKLVFSKAITTAMTHITGLEQTGNVLMWELSRNGERTSGILLRH